ALVIGGVLLGCSPILVRTSHIGPIATAFWRVTFALVPLVALFGRAGRTGTAGRIPSTAGDHLLAAMPGMFLAGALAAWHISLHLTSLTNSTLLANMAPVVVALYSWIVLRQRLGAAFVAGLALSIAGVFVLNGGIGSADSHLRGDGMALLASCFYA